MGLQGVSLTVFEVHDKITAMKKKLKLLATKVRTVDVAAFLSLETCVELGSSMEDQFTEYFPVEVLMDQKPLF